jgi:primase-polymerase (primpol)-like protein
MRTALVQRVAERPGPNGLPTLRSNAECDNNREKFKRLYDDGDLSGSKSSSEADAALAMMLGFWSQDVGQIQRLLESSKLSREKWDREDYLPLSFAKIGSALEAKQVKWLR